MTDTKTEQGKTDVIDVTFMSDGELRARGGRGVFDGEQIALLAKVFDPAQIEALKVLEIHVLKWIRRDPRNAVAYLHDPFGCIEKSGLVEDPALLARLRMLAEALRAQGVTQSGGVPAGVRLRVR